MNLLSIETASAMGSVAVTDNGRLLGQIMINQQRAQSRHIVESIEFLLHSCGLKGEQLDGVAISIGPGSYTGLRIGLSIAKSLCYCWGKSLVGVNSLDALAQLGSWNKEWICPLIRFRRDEYYTAFYKWDGENISRQSDYQVLSLTQIIEERNEPKLLLGIVRNEDQELIETYSSQAISYFPDRYPTAYWVGVLGAQNLNRGFVEDVQGLTPFYMHEFPLKNS